MILPSSRARSWLVSQTCQVPCGDDHERWGLCHRLPHWARGPAGEHMLRAPLFEWLRVCILVKSWEMCTRLSVASPLFSKALGRLIVMLPRRDSLAVVSLESLLAEPVATMHALSSFLHLKSPWQPASPLFPAHNVHAASSRCQQHMHNQLDLRVNLYFRQERRWLASVLRVFAPSKLPLPAVWRQYLRPAPNISDEFLEAVMSQPMKASVIQT